MSAATIGDDRLHLRTGLRAWWGCHEVSGNRLDSSGNNNTLIEAFADPEDPQIVSSAPGLIGLAASFDASAYLSLSAALVAGPVFSLSCWYLPTTLGTRFLVNQNSTAGLGFTMGAGLNRFFTASGFAVTHPFAPSTTIWNHMVGVFTGKDLSLYYNGIQRAWSLGSATYGGSFGVGASSLGAAAFVGLLQMVGVWDRALTQYDVNLLYNGGAGRDYPF